MTSNLIKIKKLPIKIKLKFIEYLHKQLNIVGYKIIQSNYQVPIIELSNHIRIWMLPYEIKIYSKLI